MLRLESVFATDQITRDRTKFTPGALAGALVQSYGIGLPSLVSHDNSRPLGWTTPRVLYFEPHRTRLCGLIEVPESKEEQARLGHAFGEFWGRQVAVRNTDVERLHGLLAAALRGDESTVINECTSCYAPGLARRAIPELFVEDDDGLVELSALHMIAPGVYRAGPEGQLVVFAHHYLRRSLSPANSLNVPLLEQLHALEKSVVRPRIALDPDMVGLAATYRPVLEHQYWWGPKFSEDLSSIEVGVTRHEATNVERFFHGISRTEFRWQSRKGEHIFEVEEVRNHETAAPASLPFGCRFAHAIVQEGSGELIHFDGAVRLYSEEQLLERLDSNLGEAGRDKEYRKLWRLDGGLPVPIWKRLLSDYFRDNYLVGEYLGAPPEARFGPAEHVAGDRVAAGLPATLGGRVPASTRKEPPPPLKRPQVSRRERRAAERAERKLAKRETRTSVTAPQGADTSGPASELALNDASGPQPVSRLSLNEGPRVALSIVPMRPVRGERAIHALDSLTPTGGDPSGTPVIDSNGLEVVKLIRREGASINLDDDAVLIAYEDQYHNVPIVWHAAAQGVRVTARALRSLAAAMAAAPHKDGSKTIENGHALAVGVAIPLAVPRGSGDSIGADEEDNDRILPMPAEAALLVTVRGEARDVRRIFETWDRDIQPALERRSRMPAAVADALSILLESWTVTDDAFDAVRRPIQTGMVSFAREQLAPNEWELEGFVGATRIVANIDPKRRPLLAARVEQDRLVPAPVVLMYDVECHLCGSSYRTCPHVKGVDTGCWVEVRKADVVSAIVTDRPAWDPKAGPRHPVPLLPAR
jgi:hypothetical protein